MQCEWARVRVRGWGRVEGGLVSGCDYITTGNERTYMDFAPLKPESCCSPCQLGQIFSLLCYATNSFENDGN